MEQIRIAAGAVLWCAGLLMAGSNGPCFPLINIAGAFVFGIACLLLAKKGA